MVTGPSQPISHRSSDLTLVSHPSPAWPYLFITCLIVTMSISKLTSFFVPPLSPEALHLWCFPLPDSRVIHVWGVLWPGQRLQGDSNSNCDIQIASLCDCLESGAITLHHRPESGDKFTVSQHGGGLCHNNSETGDRVARCHTNCLFCSVSHSEQGVNLCQWQDHSTVAFNVDRATRILRDNVIIRSMIEMKTRTTPVLILKLGATHIGW